MVKSNKVLVSLFHVNDHIYWHDIMYMENTQQWYFTSFSLVAFDDTAKAWKFFKHIISVSKALDFDLFNQLIP